MPLLVPHVDEVKAALGESVIQALTLIFENSSGVPPGTPRDRFRADHPGLMNVLDTLRQSSIFLRQDDSNANYHVTGSALPLIDSPRATQLLEYMDAAYMHIQGHYKAHLKEPLLSSALVDRLGVNINLALEALCYMKDINGWWSSLNGGFPVGENSSVTIDEQVLVHKTFVGLLARIYEWDYVKPEHKAKNSTNMFQSFGVSGKSPGFFNNSESTEYPAWFDLLEEKNKALLDEIDNAMRIKLLALPLMGLRALLDNVMTEKLGDVGNFKEKLKQFEKCGYVTAKQAVTIRNVLDAGHAAMHRTYFPNIDDLQTCVDVVKHLMQGLYELQPKSQVVAKNVPPRPNSK